MRLEDLDTFLTVAEQGSLTAAADKLGVPKSTVSRRVARLERDLNQSLFTRGSDGTRLTAAGQNARDRGHRVLAEVACLEGHGPRPPDVLTIAVVPEICSTQAFFDVLAAYRTRHPDVICMVNRTTRRIDLEHEPVQVVVRMHLSQLLGSQSLKVRGLGHLRGGVYASPDWAEAHPLSHPKDLAEVGVLALAGGTTRHQWVLEHPEQGSLPITIQPAVLGSELPWLGLLAEAGHGPCLLPPHIGEPAEAAGRLVRVLPDWRTPKVRLSVLWLETGPLPGFVRDFIDLMPNLDALIGA